MNRFILTRGAMADLQAIKQYLNGLPYRHTVPVREGLHELLQEIAAHPHRGFTHSLATRILGQEVKTRLFSPYRIFYRVTGQRSEILAILHAARDMDAILEQRLQ